MIIRSNPGQSKGAAGWAKQFHFRPIIPNPGRKGFGPQLVRLTGDVVTMSGPNRETTLGGIFFFDRFAGRRGIRRRPEAPNREVRTGNLIAGQLNELDLDGVSTRLGRIAGHIPRTHELAEEASFRREVPGLHNDTKWPGRFLPAKECVIGPDSLR